MTFRYFQKNMYRDKKIALIFAKNHILSQFSNYLEIGKQYEIGFNIEPFHLEMFECIRNPDDIERIKENCFVLIGYMQEKQSLMKLKDVEVLIGDNDE